MDSIEETSFDDVQDQFQDGDMILVRTGHKWTSVFLKIWTNSDYYHAALIFKMKTNAGTERWMVIEQATGGQRIVALSTYSDYDVFRFDGIDFANKGQYLIDQSGSVDYSYGDLVSIDVYEKFGIKLPDWNGEVCSGMVASFLQRCGYDIPTFVSPKGLFKHYSDRLKFKIRPIVNTRDFARRMLFMPKKVYNE